MDLLRKLTQLITPPPFRKTPKPRYTPWKEEGPSLAAILKPLLKRLTTLPSVEEPAAQECLSEIKQVALKKGLYLTAFEIKNRLDMMPWVDTEGTRHNKQRGYVLAADFILGHVRREINAIRTESALTGPRVFAGYCNEMVACLLNGDNVRRAIEIPVLVVDELLFNAIDHFKKIDVYLDLAAQALGSTTALAKQRFEREMAEAGGKSRRKARNGVSAPQTERALPTIDQPVIDYLEQLQRKLQQAQHRFSQYHPRTQTRQEGPGAISTDFPAQVEHFQAMLRIADMAGYAAFSGAVREQLGLLLQRGQPGKGIEFFRSAGEAYEAQGDQESQLYFTKLSAKRYEKACEQFLRANDRDRAAKAQSKIANTASPTKQ